ncbi:MAG: helix-turn-helix domain-containing protein [Candidatus Omnitrophica bacterium]|nr:helix-turn-helix domain-containing protein [Candidatus Omnitrophota bacterium]
MSKNATYADKLLADERFKQDFEQEYKNLVISEKIAELRHRAHLTQEQLAERIHTTKSAISRYEGSRYQGYSLSLLQKIAVACGADLQVNFVVKKNRKTLAFN